MKKVLFFLILTYVATNIFAQKKVEFYYGDKKITEIKCEDNLDYTNLKVKIPAIPQEALKYDKIIVKMALHHWNDGKLKSSYTAKTWVGKEEIKKQYYSKKDIYLTMFGNNTDFRINHDNGTFPLYNLDKHHRFSSTINICDYPRNELHLQKTSIMVEVDYYNISETRQKYYEGSGTWGTVNYYKFVKSYVAGEIPITLKPFDQSWTDDNKFVKINFADPSKVNTGIVNSYNSQISYEIRDKARASEYLNFKFSKNKKSEIEELPLYLKTKKKAGKKGIEYSPLKFTADVIENRIGYNTLNNVSTFDNKSLHDERYIYEKTKNLKLEVFYTTFFDSKYEDKSIHNILTSGRSAPKNVTVTRLFKKEKLGNNTYYVFKTNDVEYYSSSANRTVKTPSYFICLFETDNYIYKIVCYKEAFTDIKELKDDDIKLIKETLAKIEFLK